MWSDNYILFLCLVSVFLILCKLNILILCKVTKKKKLCLHTNTNSKLLSLKFTNKISSLTNNLTVNQLSS